jgi:hypothetical protein
MIVHQDGTAHRRIGPIGRMGAKADYRSIKGTPIRCKRVIQVYLLFVAVQMPEYPPLQFGIDEIVRRIDDIIAQRVHEASGCAHQRISKSSTVSGGAMISIPRYVKEEQEEVDSVSEST